MNTAPATIDVMTADAAIETFTNHAERLKHLADRSAAHADLLAAMAASGHATDLAISRLSSPILDVTQGAGTGADISTRLQEALDNLHHHKRPIYIPGGEWKLSKTIRTPYRSGLTLLGAGRGTDAPDRFIGSRTLLRWTGEPGGLMFAIETDTGTIGDFTLAGDKTTTGILITKPRKGLGTGKITFRPLTGRSLDTVVHVGESLGMSNCDCLRFDWLEALGCNRAYRSVNTMAMGMTFGQLDLTNTPVGLEIDGGGNVWIQNSLIVGGSTLLKINEGDGTGKNNGDFRLSNTKVDAQARDDFMLVDCAESYPIRIQADGGMHSNGELFKGTFARLCGGNHLVLSDWTSSFHNIVGSKDEKYGTPTVMVRDSRVWGAREAMFAGHVSARVRDCVTSRGEWIDFDLEVAQ